MSLTIPPLVGQYMNEIKNIATAVQQFANIPTASMLAQLPGSILNLGSLLSKLSNSQRRQATQNMSPHVVNAFDSMMNLMTHSESNGMMLTDGRIHEETYTKNMIDLLSQVTNLPDLVSVMQRLIEDPTIRGMENFAKQADSGLLATIKLDTQGNPDNTDGVSHLYLTKTVGESIVHFDDGFSLNISNKTYIVTTADQNSNQITIHPTINENIVKEKVYVYLPVAEFSVDGAYGNMTMTLDMNGNMSPNRQSSQKLQQAISSLMGLMQSAQAGTIDQFLFGSARQLMSKALQFIPNNIRAQLINEVASKAKQALDPSKKRTGLGQYPGIGVR